MLELAIDIETYSDVDLKTVGVYRYAQDPSFEVLLFGYSVDGGPIYVIDKTADEEIPGDIVEALSNPKILKTAYNAAFEIACLSAHFGIQLDASQWSCTQALAAQAGYPFGLDAVAKVMGTVDQKDAVGKALIKYFCVPCKPTKTNGQRTRNLPAHDSLKWQQFINYCAQDIATEQAVRKSVLTWFSPTPFEDKLWALDQKINTRGVMIDTELVINALQINDIETDRLMTEVRELTGITNPNSDAQIKAYILERTGIVTGSMNKDCMPDIFKMFKDDEHITELLNLRQMLSRTSIKKFEAMRVSVGIADRIRGLFQYYGANRTGRWAGRNVQLHNLKRNNLKDLDFARRMVKECKLDILRLTYVDIGEVLSNLIRSAFIPTPGKKLVVGDLSAIEARVTAWLAGEKWRLDVFAGHGKIYEASASMMFNIPLGQITKEIRQRGKVAELALGYQGGVGALIRMGGEAMGLSEPEMDAIKVAWRKTSPNIVRLWNFCNQAAISATTGKGDVNVNAKCRFFMKNGNMHIQLPSGRCLVYLSAKYDGKKVTYWGMDQVKKVWCKQDTYGGKLVENIVQATARDVIADAIVRADAIGLDVTMHVHDEIVVEEFEYGAEDAKKILTAILKKDIPWAKGLKLGAETFIANYYTK